MKRMHLPISLLGFWLILPATALQAQPPPLFELQEISIEALDPQAQQRWQVLQRLPMMVRLQVVRLPEQLWRYRAFTLAVDAAGCLVLEEGQGLRALTARLKELSVLSEEAVAWNGRIYADASVEVGEVSLVVMRTGAVTGHLLLGDWEYWVRPLSEGLHALVEIDPRKYPREWPGSPYYDGGGIPEEPVLAGVYPNPVRDRLVVRFGLPAAEEVELRVYDVLGREVVRRQLGRVAAGWHRVELATGAWSSGRYVVVLRVGERTLTQSITRVR
ncbi:MAG: T9SS type A sorting domain-containing protein [Rhodothermus sp.]|nr:T9SS type A sorting domain-containing protein [Rhodothermus sp.]